ncbi:MAG: thiamine pyrophosphate-dependent enzyme [Marinifilaceae bacterium]
MAKYIGELIVDILKASNVKRVWGITGDSANFITEAIFKSDIKFMHVRHEEVAGFACGGDALVNNNLSVCIGSCGPGALHLVYGLYDANRNGAPVLCIATQIPKNEIGTNYVQETDTISLYRDCSVYCEYVQSAEQLPRIMGIAMQTAVARKGVAVIVVPGDISSQALSGKPNTCYVPHHCNPVIIPGNEELSTLAQLINGSEKITVIGGKGCEKAEESVKSFVQKIKAPLGWSFNSKAFLAYDNPYPIGCIGAYGDQCTEHAIKQSELLLLLGIDGDCEMLDNTNATKVQLINQGENLAQNHWIDYGFVGNVKDTLDALLPLLDTKDKTTFAEESAKIYNNKLADYKADSEKITGKQNKISAEYLMALLNSKTPNNCNYCLDTGTPLILGQRYITASKERRFFQSAEYSSMGNAMPTSFGVSCAEDDTPVIAVCGDGGISMLLGDLLTVLQERIHVKILILNNSRYDFFAKYTGKDSNTGVQLGNTNFAQLAQNLGIPSLRVEQAAELEKSMEQWLLTPGACVMDVVVE